MDTNAACEIRGPLLQNVERFHTFIVKSAPAEASFHVELQKSTLKIGSFWCHEISGVKTFIFMSRSKINYRNNKIAY